MDQAFGLIRRATEDMAERLAIPPGYRASRSGAGRPDGPRPAGRGIYGVELADGRVARCQPRSASFHNLVLMHEVFTGEILTDFPFIEASSACRWQESRYEHLGVRGLRNGVVTTRWPGGPIPTPTAGAVPARALGPTDSVDPALCPAGAIRARGVDQGRCILCGRCVAERPDLFAWSRRHRSRGGRADPGSAGRPRTPGDR